jgi:RNA-directed DNA polymerase
MMNERGKSDRPVVPVKSSNKAEQSAAEGMEGRGLTKGNPLEQNASRTQSRSKGVSSDRSSSLGSLDAPSALERIRQAASKDKEMRFTALCHHIYAPEALRAAYLCLKREAAPGVDGETWRHYGEDLEINLQDLSHRLKQGAYRAMPVRRVYIPKADGRLRPLGVTALEDKIVQRAAVEVLNAIYETDFLGFSYGFRPKRSQHNALDALYTGLLTKKVNWVLDLDIRGFFDAISHEWLVKFIEHRIADRRVVRLIQKWLNAGVLEDGKRIRMEEGTPQGGSASPLLANIYLHYVFDLWAQAWRRKQAHGDVIVVRYADGTPVQISNLRGASPLIPIVRSGI